jgi:hypothetical protein
MQKMHSIKYGNPSVSPHFYSEQFFKLFNIYQKASIDTDKSHFLLIRTGMHREVPTHVTLLSGSGSQKLQCHVTMR